MRACATTLCALTLLFAVRSASAQPLPALAARAPAAPSRQISLRPMLLVFNQLGLDYEQALPGSWSLLAAGKVELSSGWTLSQAAGSLNAFLGLSMPSQYSSLGFGAELGPRLWLGGRPLQGFFLHPSLGYDWSLSGTSNNSSNISAYEVASVDVPNVHRLMANLRAGSQWAFANRLLVSISGGLYYAYLHADATYAGDDGLGLGAVKEGWHAAGLSPDLHVALGGWF